MMVPSTSSPINDGQAELSMYSSINEGLADVPRLLSDTEATRNYVNMSVDWAETRADALESEAAAKSRLYRLSFFVSIIL